MQTRVRRGSKNLENSRTSSLDVPFPFVLLVEYSQYLLGYLDDRKLLKSVGKDFVICAMPI